MMEMESDQQSDNCLSLCLICGEEKCEQFSDDGGGGGGSSVITKQLNVIYILKHLLQVPSQKLQQFLKKCGNPDNWISLCDTCTKLTDNAREYNLQIVEIQKKERKIQKIIIDRVKSSSLQLSSLVKLIKPKNNRDQFKIWKDTRKFVESYNYGDIWEDPLLHHNKLSKYPPPPHLPKKPLIHSESEPSAPQVKIEDHPQSSEVDLYTDVFPFPPSPFSSGDPQNFTDDWLASPSPPPVLEAEPLTSFKNDIEISITTTAPTLSQSQPPIKKRRGRPRKIKTENDTITTTPAPPKPSTSKVTENPTTTVTTFSKRGRPRKISTKPIIDSDNDDDGDEWVPSPTTAAVESEEEAFDDPDNSEEDEDNPNTTTTSSASSTRTQNPKQCHHCPSIFKATATLFAHMTEAHNIQKFPCGLPGCTAQLKNVKQYLRHRRIRHAPGGSGYRKKTSTPAKRLSRQQKRILKRSLKLPPVPLDTTPTPCHLCGKTIPLSSLNDHLFKHKDTELALAAQDGATSTNGTFKCPVIGCKIEYNTQKGYQKHLDAKHGGSAENPIRQFKCSFCPKEFCHRRKWREHEDTHKNASTKPYKCKYCGKGFAVDKYLDHHVRYTHEIKRTKLSGPDGTDARIKETFHCPNCTAVFPFYTHLFNHIKTDHQMSLVPCLITGCLRKFETLKQFAKHRARHRTIKNDKIFYEEQRYHECIYCDAKFLFPASLFRHLRGQHEVERMPCLEVGCMRTFGTIKQYQKHKTYCVFREGVTPPVKKKKEKGPRVLCEICGGDFVDKESLRSHVVHVHEGKKRSYGKGMTCHLCGARVPGGHLKMHMRKKHKELVEFQVETFRCPVVGCGTKYVRKDCYEKHMKERHGEGEGGGGWKMPFKCEFCGKGFCHRRKQRQHELIHRNKGNPSFMCGDCGKGFITARYLQYHRAYTHEGRRRGVKKGSGSGGMEYGEVKNEEDNGSNLNL